MTKKIGVLTGGGDSSGINAAIRTIAVECARKGYTLTGIRGGWRGLLNADYQEINLENTEGITFTGGTILGTSRTNPFKMENGVEKILAEAEKAGFDAVIAIGGDDTLGVAGRLSERGLKTVGIPQTIDNDIYGTEYCIGFDTAASNIVRAIQIARDTCRSHHQDIVLEIMGRDAGWLAAVAGLAAEAEIIILPEETVDIELVTKKIENLHKVGNDHSVILVAEGCTFEGMKRLEEEKIDAFGHVKLPGIAYSLKSELENRTGYTIRVDILGYQQRGGRPTVTEVRNAQSFALAAVDYISQGLIGKFTSMRNGRVIAEDIKVLTGKNRPVDAELIEIVRKSNNL